MTKIQPISGIYKGQPPKERIKTLQERIESIKQIRDGYPDGHSQIGPINAIIVRLEELQKNGGEY